MYLQFEILIEKWILYMLAKKTRESPSGKITLKSKIKSVFRDSEKIQVCESKELVPDNPCAPCRQSWKRASEKKKKDRKVEKGKKKYTAERSNGAVSE